MKHKGSMGQSGVRLIVLAREAVMLNGMRYYFEYR